MTAALTDAKELRRLYAELRALPCDQPEPKAELPGAGNVLVPLQFRVGGAGRPEQVLSFISITAVFGTPLDVTPAELAIEALYPADDATSEYLRRWASAGGARVDPDT